MLLGIFRKGLQPLIHIDSSPFKFSGCYLEVHLYNKLFTQVTLLVSFCLCSTSGSCGLVVICNVETVPQDCQREANDYTAKSNVDIQIHAYEIALMLIVIQT